jgi:hypothetical protein
MDPEANREKARNQSATGQRPSPASFSEGGFVIVMDRQDEFGLPTCDEETEKRLTDAMAENRKLKRAEFRALNFWLHKRIAVVRRNKLERIDQREPLRRSPLCD